MKETELEKLNKYYMQQNLLQTPDENSVMLENGTTIIEGKSIEDDENKTNEEMYNYER